MPDKVKITHMQEVRPNNTYYDYPAKDSVIVKNQKSQAAIIDKNRRDSIQNKG
jgi:hypothetical protein